MSIKFIPKVGAAVALLVIVLIFLGVNYVPQIHALSLPKGNSVDAVRLARPDYIDEQYPRAILPKLSFQRNTVVSVKLARSDYVDEQYPRAILPQPSLQSNTTDSVKPARPDYVDERYPRAIVP
jgi:hypothetical protein